MHVLVIIAETAQRFLIKIESEDHIEQIKHLVRSRKRRKAIESALQKGRLIKELKDDEILSVNADLTLTKEGSYWSLF